VYCVYGGQTPHTTLTEASWLHNFTIRGLVEHPFVECCMYLCREDTQMTLFPPFFRIFFFSFLSLDFSYSSLVPHLSSFPTIFQVPDKLNLPSVCQIIMTSIHSQALSQCSPRLTHYLSYISQKTENFPSLL
jgi:hypothetical protein